MTRRRAAFVSDVHLGATHCHAEELATFLGTLDVEQVQQLGLHPDVPRGRDVVPRRRRARRIRLGWIGLVVVIVFTDEGLVHRGRHRS